MGTLTLTGIPNAALAFFTTSINCSASMSCLTSSPTYKVRDMTSRVKRSSRYHYQSVKLVTIKYVHLISSRSELCGCGWQGRQRASDGAFLILRFVPSWILVRSCAKDGAI